MCRSNNLNTPYWEFRKREVRRLLREIPPGDRERVRERIMAQELLVQKGNPKLVDLALKRLKA